MPSLLASSTVTVSVGFGVSALWSCCSRRNETIVLASLCSIPLILLDIINTDIGTLFRAPAGTALPPSNTYQTASQYGPITPPASSQATAAPTNEAETLASLSDLASEGAASVYATRSNNQQPASSNVGTAPLTGTILASDTTSVVTSDPTSDPNNAAFQGRSNFLGAAAAAGWVGMPLVAAAFGAAIVAL